MIFDTHCHLQYGEYENIENELKIMKSMGVTHATLIGSDFEENKNALMLAKKYPNLFVVAGIKHPIDAPFLEDLDEEIIKIDKQIGDNIKYIVGIGEVGLDYYHAKDDNEKIQQKLCFLENIKLAKKYSLPLVVHIRDAWEEGLKILKESQITKFVVHCYTGNPQIAEEILKISNEAYIGFSGIVTFKNARDVAESVNCVPLNRILVETDAPFLSPEPFRGKQNTPGYTKFVLDKIKELRNEAPDEIEKTIYNNSFEFYSIKN